MESQFLPRGGANSRGQEFQRDEAAKLGVFGLIHHPHAAATQLLEDTVMGNGPADQ